MKEPSVISGYRYDGAEHSCAHAYLMPAIHSDVARIKSHLLPSWARFFDLGCGNGGVSAELTKMRLDVAGVDPSSEGIAAAKAAYPGLRLELGSAYDDLVPPRGVSRS